MTKVGLFSLLYISNLEGSLIGINFHLQLKFIILVDHSLTNHLMYSLRII